MNRTLILSINKLPKIWVSLIYSLKLYAYNVVKLFPLFMISRMLFFMSYFSGSLLPQQ
jgi:hypothetical protein